MNGKHTLNQKTLPSNLFYLSEISSLINSINESFAICIIINTKGSTPRKIGSKMIVTNSGKIVGTIGGGALEKNVIKNAQQVIKENKPQTFKHDLLHHHNMCCGGSVEIYIEPIKNKMKLYVFGAGHTGNYLSKYAVDFGFDTYVIDDRKEFIDTITHPNINKMCLDFDKALNALPYNEDTFICIMTYDHATDRKILMHCIAKPFAYIGMIGSKRKVELTKKLLSESGSVSEELIKKIDMPMGLNIHSETPQEIAISILAKIINEKNSTNEHNK